MAEKVAVMKTEDFKSSEQKTEDLEREIAELEAAHKAAREGDQRMADEAFAPDLDDNSDEDDTDEEESMVEETEPNVEEESGESTKKSREESDGHDWKKRHGDLRRWSQEQIKERDDKIADMVSRLESLESAQEQAEELKTLSSPEDLEKFRQEYPDFDRMLKTYLHNEMQRLEPTITKKLKKVDEIDRDIRIRGVVNKIMSVHPDMMDIKESQDLADLLGSKSKYVRNIVSEAANPDADALIDVINMFKLETGKQSKAPAKKGQRKATDEVAEAPLKRDSKSPKPAKKFQYSESMIANMSADEYEANEKDIMQARRDGKFLYDISGVAPTE